MYTIRLYENKSHELVAIVYEDEMYVNYIPCPEIVALDGDSFLEEARLGFPDSIPYDDLAEFGQTLEKAAAQEERESTLVAQLDEKTILYPQRMSPETQEFFQIELGDDVWQALLEQATGDEGVQLDF